jgi:exopolysaccharide biosynthesis protein
MTFSEIMLKYVKIDEPLIKFLMFIILFVVIALVAWSLHLMQQAVENREFSLMLAGTLVASAAAAMMTVYFLMNNYMGYVTQATSFSSGFSPSASSEQLHWASRTGDFMETGQSWKSAPSLDR